MKYVLNLAKDGRVLSASYMKFAPADAVMVDVLPVGDITDYRYVDGEFINDPIPKQGVDKTPTQLDIIEAQVTYTAMMTNTLLEV